MATEVKIAEFRARLSEHLRAVRKGHEIVIRDRETPIARVVPYTAARQRLETIPPTKSLKEVELMLRRLRRPRKLTLKDLEDALREERKDRFDDLLK